ncbi:hypothetical protein PMI24_03765 [Pseudomonas sp. GM25]|nr:hypothetical protein PMI24_03765 [Pseudomonas sp. GM25]
MIQVGAMRVTWQQVLLEYQRDRAHKDNYQAVMDLVLEHSGAYGMGVNYAIHYGAQVVAAAGLINRWDKKDAT